MLQSLHQRLFARHLDDDEKIILLVHHHWLTGLKKLFIPVCLWLADIALIPFAGTSWMLEALLIGVPVIGIWCLRVFFDYYLDAWVISNHGIIDIEWHGWFHRQSTRVLYSDIQGVSYEIKGVWETLLHVGSISIEKISTGAAISMSYVKRPKRVETVVLRCMEEYLHKKNLKDAKTVQELLTTVVAREMQAKDVRQRRQSPPMQR